MPNATVRANAQAMPIDRRLFLAFGTAAAAFGAVHATAEAAHSDSQLDALFDEWRRASAAYVKAGAAQDAAEDSFEPIPSPFYRMGLDEGGWCKGFGRLVCDLSGENIAELREFVAEGAVALGGDDASFCLRLRAERAARTLRKIEDCLSRRARQEEAVGLDALIAEAERLYDIRENLADKILDRLAQSPRELAIQAEVALRREGSGETVLRRLAELYAPSAAPISA